MTKDEAIKAMDLGETVTHSWFSPEEWVKKTGDKYEFEDGCKCEFVEFWQYRDDGSWLNNWSICPNPKRLEN